MDSLSIALYQGPGCIDDLAGSLALLERQAGAARRLGATLLLLPEMFLSGYHIGAARARRHALRPEELRAPAAIARRQGIALAFGYPERVGDQIANAAVLIDAEGAVRLNYRKTHLYGEIDRDMFQCIGSEFPLVEFHRFRIGLLICYDIEFPEAARRLALAGADILLVPTAQMQPFEAVARHVIPARAYENQLYVAYANHSGREDGLDYIGLSSICGPDGAVLACAGSGEELLLARCERAHLEQVRAANPLLGDRRPELYRAVAG